MKFVYKLLIWKQGEGTIIMRVSRRHTAMETRERRKFKGNGRKNAAVKKEGEKFTCKHCSKDGHDEDHCWKLHPEIRPKKFGNNNKGKSKTVATVLQDLGSDSGDETKITAMGYQGKGSVASTSSSSNANVNVTQ
jgi:hypothetical protein